MMFLEDARKQSEFITAYLEYQRLSRSEHRSERLLADQYFWACEELREQTLVEPSDNIVDLLVELCEVASGDVETIGVLGAGAVEDLVNNHGERFVDEIEQAARRHPQFRTCLSHVWFSEQLEPALRDRLARLAGQ